MKHIHIIGLGPGVLDDLPLGCLEILKQSRHTVLRTERHPVVQSLRDMRFEFETCDDIYESEPTFEKVYEKIVTRVLERATEFQEVVYAVPGHPGVAERTVQMLQKKAREVDGLQVTIGPGKSFLDDLLAKVGADPADGLLILDGTDLLRRGLNPSLPTVILQVYNRDVASEVKLTLMEQYPDEYEVVVAQALGVPGEEKLLRVPLYEIDRLSMIDHLTTLFVPGTSDASILNRQFFRLVEVVEQLRGPNGCPWDRKQTHVSLRKYMLEEAYEAVDAIDRDAPDDLCEELGDVLLQVALHSQIAAEEGNFSIYDTIAAINEKMIRRHPHVFSDVHVKDADEVVQNWEAIKTKERQLKSGTSDTVSFLDTIPKSLPALQMAYELQKKAAEVGFEWEHIAGVYDKLEEELAEFREAAQTADPKELENEYGDLLFVLINLSRYLKIDPETALAATNRKFRNRFNYIEQQLKQRGSSLHESSLAEMDKLWNDAKKIERDRII
jgi:tetrapyrrole methylase family protein / MazG family protein